MSARRAQGGTRVRAAIKRLLVGSARVPGIRASLRYLLQGRATVFMLHRFRVPDLGVEGHDPVLLREALAYLRREGYDLIGLEELFDRLEQGGTRLERTVVFTLDDGYAEQGSVAAPIFAEFDCPSTTFLTSGFLDGSGWMWWDQIDLVFERVPPARLGDLMSRMAALPEPAAGWLREGAAEAFTAWCKTIADDAKHAAIVDLARDAQVELPERPPTRYAPMSWTQARSCERGGMTFGPHTVTHPILTRTPDEQSRREIEASWRRLREELADPVPVFCYPNGQPGDYGDREMATLRSLDFRGAMSGRAGYARELGDGRSEREVFCVPRFAWPDSLTDVLQCVTGIERLKSLVRRGG